MPARERERFVAIKLPIQPPEHAWLKVMVAGERPALARALQLLKDVPTPSRGRGCRRVGV
jgi:hypothetical protein